MLPLAAPRCPWLPLAAPGCPSLPLAARTSPIALPKHQEDTLRTRMEDLLRDVYAEHPGLLDRIRVFGVIDYGAREWLNPLTSTQLKLAVKEMLGLE